MIMNAVIIIRGLSSSDGNCTNAGTEGTYSSSIPVKRCIRPTTMVTGVNILVMFTKAYGGLGQNTPWSSAPTATREGDLG